MKSIVKHPSRLLFVAVCSWVCLMTQSIAQVPTVRLDRPDISVIDMNNVAMTGGKPHFNIPLVAIGSGEAQLRLNLTLDPEKIGFTTNDNLDGGLSSQPYPTRLDRVTHVAHTGDSSELFYLINGQYVSYTGQGSTIVSLASTYEYRRHDGVIYIYDKSLSNRTSRSKFGALSKIKYPSGNEIIFTYGAESSNRYQLKSVRNSFGYRIHFNSSSTARNVAFNETLEYCAPSAIDCNIAAGWPVVTSSSAAIAPMPEHEGNLKAVSFVDAGGRTTRWTVDENNQIVRFKSPESNSDDLVFSYCRHKAPFNCYSFTGDGTAGGTTGGTISGLLVGSTNRGISTTYDFHSQPNTANYFATATATGPLGTHKVLTLIQGRPGPLLSVTDASGNSVQYEESDRNFAVSSSHGGGTRFEYYYDARGNVVEKRQTAIAGSGEANLSQTAGYDASCVNLMKCNKPNWIRDAKGNQTDFEYDPAHGGLIKETMPADDKGIRPQKRYTYSQRHAWVKNAAGGYSRGHSAVWLLTRMSYCRTGGPAASGAGCALGAADEVSTTYEYGPDSGPNNLWLRGEVVTATDDGVSQTRRTCYSYDRLGNKRSQTTPLAGLASCP